MYIISYIVSKLLTNINLRSILKNKKTIEMLMVESLLSQAISQPVLSLKFNSKKSKNSNTFNKSKVKSIRLWLWRKSLKNKKLNSHSNEEAQVRNFSQTTFKHFTIQRSKKLLPRNSNLRSSIMKLHSSQAASQQINPSIDCNTSKKEMASPSQKFWRSRTQTKKKLSSKNSFI